MNAQASTLLRKNKPYLYLISSQIVSSLGDWLDLLAILALAAFKWEASSLELAGLSICLLAPMVVFGPISGVLADKLDRKKLMIFSDVIRCIIVLAFVFTTAIWQIYILLILKSIFSSLFIPAKNGKLKEIIPDEHIQPAMAISGMIESGSKIVGPMLSGIIVSLIGFQWAFYLDAASFLLSALLLIGVPSTITIVAEKANGKKKMVQEMMEGLSTIKKIPILLYGLFVFSLAILVLQIADTQIMILFRMVDGIRPTDVAGYSIAANGLGMLVMSIFLSKKAVKSTGIYMGVGAAVLGFIFIIGAISTGFPPLWFMISFPFFFLLSGFAVGAIIIPFQIMAQKNTPVEYTGRVFGTITSMTTLASLIGMVSGGILAQLFGVIFAYILSGSLLVIVGIVVMIKKNRFEGRVSVAENERRLHGETTA